MQTNLYTLTNWPLSPPPIILLLSLTHTHTPSLSLLKLFLFLPLCLSPSFSACWLYKSFSFILNVSLSFDNSFCLLYLSKFHQLPTYFLDTTHTLYVSPLTTQRFVFHSTSHNTSANNYNRNSCGCSLAISFSHLWLKNEVLSFRRFCSLFENEIRASEIRTCDLVNNCEVT